MPFATTETGNVPVSELAATLSLTELLEYYRNENTRLARADARAQLRKSHLTNIVNEALLEHARANPYPSMPAPPKRTKRRTRTAETALILVSDLQIGSKTSTYNTEICRNRLRTYADKITEIADIQRSHHPISTARVYLLGDLVQGEQIYPSQPWELDQNLLQQTVIAGPDILGEFLAHLLTDFKEIDVFGVAGNHGAVGGEDRKRYAPDTNFDMMLYHVLRERFGKNPRIRWHLKIEEPWYDIDEIGKKRYLLLHGHQFRIRALNNHAGVVRKIYGWLAGTLGTDFHYILMGHQHTPSKLAINHMRLWINGTTETDSRFAREQLAACNEATQTLLFAHPVHGVTAEYEIYLAGENQ